MAGAIEQVRNFFDSNLYSHNIKRLITNETASANMHIADQIVELGVGAILVGGFELYGIQMIINARG
jgi:hypothetical protein